MNEIRLGRRQALSAALLGVLGCRRTPPVEEQLPAPLTFAAASASSDAAAPVLVDDGSLRYVRRELSLPGTLSPRVIALTPDVQSTRFPVVIALHGRGEARKGPDIGPLGWPEDYALEQALLRILTPPLTRADFYGFIDAQTLAAHNSALAARPFAGLVVLCPYLPDVDLEDAAQQDRYGQFLVDTLLPHARAELPILEGREHTGIDGISLGGAVALHVGSGFPQAFGAVSGIQPAIQSRHAERWATRLVEARERVGDMHLRLQSSEGDPFKPPTRRLSEALHARTFAHELTITPGPHDYVYNRGPAAYGLLTFHDRVLRG